MIQTNVAFRQIEYIYCDLIKCVSFVFFFLLSFSLLFLYLFRTQYIKCVFGCVNVTSSHKTHVFPATGFCSCCTECHCFYNSAIATAVYMRSSTRSIFALCCCLLYILPCCVYLCTTRHHRRLADEDDELSEVQPDAVPPEVREWLASTFTRQLVTTRKRTEEKPKFRTVAHAIRAGIFVDRIYRRVSSTAMLQFPPEVVKVLKVNVSILNNSIQI